MFHPFSSINTALSKSIQARPVLYFTAKMGASNYSQEVIDWQHDYDHIGENISLHLHLNAELIGSLPIADNAIQLEGIYLNFTTCCAILTLIYQLEFL